MGCKGEDVGKSVHPGKRIYYVLVDKSAYTATRLNLLMALLRTRLLISCLDSAFPLMVQMRY